MIELKTFIGMGIIGIGGLLYLSDLAKRDNEPKQLNLTKKRKKRIPKKKAKSGMVGKGRKGNNETRMEKDVIEMGKRRDLSKERSFSLKTKKGAQKKRVIKDVEILESEDRPLPSPAF